MPEPNSPENTQSQQILTKQLLTPAEKIYRFLEKTHFFKSQTPEGFKGVTFSEWFKNTPNEQIIRYLTLFNDLIRQQPTNVKTIDGKEVTVSIQNGFGEIVGIDYLPPQDGDKVNLLKNVINAIKTIDSPKEQGLLAYYAIQNIHPFGDGNGRTGRLIYTLFTLRDKNQPLSVERFKTILNHEDNNQKGREIFAKKVRKPAIINSYINREISKNLFGQKFFNYFGCIYVADDTGNTSISEKNTSSLENKEQESRVKQILSEGGVSRNFPFRGLVLLKLIFENPKLRKFTYLGKRNIDIKESLSTDDVGKPFLGIDAENLLRSNEITKQHLLRIIDIHTQIKRKSIETLIDIFTHPNQHTIINQTGQETPIKDTFLIKRAA
jgi:hypothetical protein